MVTPATISKEQVLDWLQQVADPEIPVLTIHDLGILRNVELHENGEVEVMITPTYNGCPAMDMISMNIRLVLAEQSVSKVKITSVLSPAWTTDWMTAEGKQKLSAYGIAPPNPRQQVCTPGLFAGEEAVQCPHCGSHHTHRISEFGSTACKALYQCDDCKEPFDYFKCH